ncbi:MAG: hypothetical protein HPY90_07690 [Syntrophothermus sp.]|uniref:hypothetical protein n=1 Tax=Syntrophothermus sp. TaxID=2736299 RepID=UPI00257EA291|nr:hypothetical protein [Syntrophothermus sp.]NSW83143.1 hypothetical protein [Syntrophothermus sp.]
MSMPRHERETAARVAAQMSTPISRETLRKMIRLNAEFKRGNPEAARLIGLLDSKEISVDTAYRRLFKADDDTVGLYVRIPRGYRDTLVALSRERGMMASEIVRQALRDYFTQIFGEGERDGQAQA